VKQRRATLLKIFCTAVLWCAAAVGAFGQPPAGVGGQRASIAANERHLWLVVEQRSVTRIFHREAGGQFDAGKKSSSRVAAQAAVGDGLLVFFEDGAVYRYTPEKVRPTVETVLPGRTIPASVTGDDRFVYAVVPSAVAREASPRVENEKSSADFDPGEAAWSLVVYDGRRWTPAAALPESIPSGDGGKLGPQLCLMRGELQLFAPSPAANVLQYFSYDADNRLWTAQATVSLPPMLDYWVFTFGRVPTLAAARRGADGAARLDAYRLLSDADSSGASGWRLTPIEYSALPEGAEIVRHLGAAGFNQHLCLLARDRGGIDYLQFGRASGKPAEITQSAPAIVTETGMALRGQKMVQIATFMILLIVLTGLFVFRRGSMVRTVELPPGSALALMTQRALAWGMDFLPIAVVAGKVGHVSLYDGLGTLLRWGVSPEPDGSAPAAAFLIWWASTTALYATYCLILEITARRTIGKMIMRIYIVSENGVSPSFGQLLTRNVLRLIECMPQFWVFAVLVLLSRNRQRLGDIFARTVVVRALRPPAATAAPRAAPGDDESVTAEDEHDETSSE